MQYIIKNYTISQSLIITSFVDSLSVNFISIKKIHFYSKIKILKWRSFANSSVSITRHTSQGHDKIIKGTKEGKGCGRSREWCGSRFWINRWDWICSTDDTHGLIKTGFACYFSRRGGKKKKKKELTDSINQVWNISERTTT